MNSVWKKKGTFLINILLLFFLLKSTIDIFSIIDYSHKLKETGEVAIWLLILTLACTPLSTVFGFKKTRSYRKIFGIYAFLFSAVHVITFISKYDWNIPVSIKTTFSEFYLILGCIAFLLMAPLFFTSTRKLVKKMKRQWKLIHKSVYAVAVFTLFHVLFVSDEINPHAIKYSVIFGILFVPRIPAVKRFFINRRLIKKAIGKTSEKNRTVKGVPFYLILVVGFVTVFHIAATLEHTEAKAEKQYQYDKNNGIFAMLATPSEMPTVNHKNTQKYCNDGCHWTYLPGLLPERSWKSIMNGLDDHFGEKVQLEPEIRQDIQTYLTTYSADYTKSRTSIKILNSIKGNTPIRVSEIPYIIKKHDDIKPSVYNRKSIKHLSNCLACHPKASLNGSFDEDEVTIPE